MIDESGIFLIPLEENVLYKSELYEHCSDKRSSLEKILDKMEKLFD